MVIERYLVHQVLGICEIGIERSDDEVSPMKLTAFNSRLIVNKLLISLLPTRLLWHSASVPIDTEKTWLYALTFSSHLILIFHTFL